MTYCSKKDKTLIVWFIFFIIISIFITFVAILEYINITGTIISLIIASFPFILVAIFKSNKPNNEANNSFNKVNFNEEEKYQIIMSIVYNKYIESNAVYLYLFINPSDDEYKNQVKQAYDELFEKMTEQEWQKACKKFYKLKEEFEKMSKIEKNKIEEQNEKETNKMMIENEKWLFKQHLKD